MDGCESDGGRAHRVHNGKMPSGCWTAKSVHLLRRSDSNLITMCFDIDSQTKQFNLKITPNTSSSNQEATLSKRLHCLWVYLVLQPNCLNNSTFVEFIAITATRTHSVKSLLIVSTVLDAQGCVHAHVCIRWSFALHSIAMQLAASKRQ